MNFRMNGNLGCLVLIVVLLLTFSVLTIFGRIIFTTPLGLVLLAYIIYVWYKRKKRVVVNQQEEVNTNSEENASNKFAEDTGPVIDVDYEDYE